MDENGVLLNEFFDNNLHIGTENEIGWFIADWIPSTGRTWQIIPDNSGVYEINEQIELPPAPYAPGAPGAFIGKIKATKIGEGSCAFNLLHPGGKEIVKTITVKIVVNVMEN